MIFKIYRTFINGKSYKNKETLPGSSAAFAAFADIHIIAPGEHTGALLAEVNGIKLYPSCYGRLLKRAAVMSGLIQISDLRRYHLYRKETDMRKGFDSLCNILSRVTNFSLIFSYTRFIFANFSFNKIKTATVRQPFHIKTC